jgi:GntR family transcriptional regulator / MocR family aminotransferase
MSVDLFVDPAQPKRTSALLFDQIRTAIGDGRLLPGDRLPTSRELASELAVSRSTVTAVYGRLLAEGFLTGRQGDGTFVARELETPRRSHAGSTGSIGEYSTALTPRRSIAVPTRPSVPTDLRIDLRTGRPDPRLFPLRDWRRCVVEAVGVSPPGYGDAAGLAALRRALAVWVNRSRGLTASADEIVVTAGAQQAFDLIVRVLLVPGDVIAIENPGYDMARRAFTHHGLRVAPIPVDREGIVVDAIPPTARAIYVTPSHQSPTGVTMSAARRRALIAFADQRGAVIIEDDYDTEFRHVDRPLEPVQRLDRSGRVLYVGTFSKTLSPSLRIGFLVAPVPIANAVKATRALIDTQPPHLIQSALTTLIVSGQLDRHLRRTRREYSARHSVVLERSAVLFSSGRILVPTRTNAGLHAMLSLARGHDAEDIAQRLRARGIAIDTTAAWWAEDPAPGLMVGFGAANSEELHQAFDELDRALRRRRRSSAAGA